MALVLIEGFDHWTLTGGAATTQVTKGWTISQSVLGASSMQTGVYSYGQRLRLNALASATNASSASALKALPSTYTTLIAGFGFRPVNFITVPRDFFVFKAGGTGIYRLQITAANKIAILNSAGTVIATSTATLLQNVDYYIETKAVIAGASGSCELYINSVQDIATTTGNFGSTAIDSIQLQTSITNAGATGAQADFDNIYVLDTTGSAPQNTYLSEIRVETLYPSADGFYSQFTPDTGTVHFSRLNEHTTAFPDGDSSYVSDSTVGHRDSLAVDDLTISSGTIYGVQHNVYARKDDASVRTLSPTVRQASTDYDATAQTLGPTYDYRSQIYNLDPTGATWTISNVNADEFGFKVAS